MTTTTSALDRHSLLDWYVRNRARSRALFDLLSDDAYYARPIALRHPIVFYEGHLPAFSFNTLIKRGLGRAPIDSRLEALFARGIDPHETQAETTRPDGWPSRHEVQQFADEADRQVVAALRSDDIERPGHPLLDRGEAAFAILEHEAMHQETLLYMWHRLPFADKRQPEGYTPMAGGAPPAQEWVDVAAGRATLGVDPGDEPFTWDNERPSWRVDVPAFAIERYPVTNDAFRAFVAAGGYAEPRWWRPEDWTWIQSEHRRAPLFWEEHDGTWQWRGMFSLVPLPPAWPVYVTFAEASAYARWRGVRLPTEAEFQRAAFGAPSGDDRHFPWGEAAPTSRHGVFDFASWDPQPVGTHPAGRSAWGLDDIVGNGWSWTSSVFEPFPGFVPTPSYPEYSADFFDGDHFVLKGASPVTARELLRPSFRNWFRPRYPYVYATFRCTRGARG